MERSLSAQKLDDLVAALAPKRVAVALPKFEVNPAQSLALADTLRALGMARAFDLSLPFAGTFTVLMFMAVGVSVPTPGAVGAFHESVRLALTSLYAADNDRAVACAVALHALSFIPVSLATLVLVAREGLTLRRIEDITRTGAPPGTVALEGSEAG